MDLAAFSSHFISPDRRSSGRVQSIRYFSTCRMACASLWGAGRFGVASASVPFPLQPEWLQGQGCAHPQFQPCTLSGWRPSPDSPEVSSERRRWKPPYTQVWTANSDLGLEAKVGNHKRLLRQEEATGFHVRPLKVILKALDEGRGWGKTFDKVWMSSDGLRSTSHHSK